MSKENSISNLWSLVERDNHSPDCSLVTDEELEQAIFTNWPSENGVAKIPYTFDPAPYWMQPYTRAFFSYFKLGLHSLQKNADAVYQQHVKENIKLGLQKWEEASNGTLQFYEAKLGLHSPGISFFFADDKALRTRNAAAFTQQKIDNNGHLEQVAITYPSRPSFWDMENKGPCARADHINTITHEEGHAIGLEHLHDPELRSKLQNMKDGVFLSVMPYYSLINPGKNPCGSTSYPPFAAMPGCLDERSVALNYKVNENTPGNNISRIFYDQNVVNTFSESAVLSGIHSALYQISANLKLSGDQSFFSKKGAQLLADGATLGILIYLDFPKATTASFTISAIAKYLPETLQEQLPTVIRQILASNYPLLALNLSTVIYEGRSIKPLIANLIAGGYGTVIGSEVGAKIGQLNAFITNKVSNTIMSFFHKTGEQNNQENAVDAPAIVETEAVRPAI